jgi:hypothetical protein
MWAVVSRIRQRVSLSAEDAVVLDEEIREAMTKLADGIEIYDTDASDTEEVMATFRPPQKLKLSEWIEKEIRRPSTVSPAVRTAK